jgi:nucleotide-binding universal stress UspA family protein
MSFTAFALILVAIWCAVGLSVSAWMRRRGHAFFTWSYVGVVLGPFVIPLAIDAIARERRDAVTTIPALPTTDRVAVLVGFDGSTESLAAARAAATLLGNRIGRFTFATVLDYDSGSSEQQDRARHEISMAMHALPVPASEPVLLVGSPAPVLADAAHAGGFDLLVVGSRGRGASRALLGSVASRLARGAGMPVLIGGASTTEAAEAAPAATDDYPRRTGLQ